MNISTLVFLTMTALAERPLHGYGILQELNALTAGETTPAVATLYRTLDRLSHEGLIEEAESEVVDGRFRRTYRLTESGGSLLAAEAKARAATARVATRRLKQLSFDPSPINPAVGGAI